MTDPLAEFADFDLMLYAQDHKEARGCYVGDTWVYIRGLRRFETMLTQDDQDIWWRLRGFRNGPGFVMRYRSADGRDYRLMSAAQAYRKTHGRDCSFLFGAVLCGGALERFAGLDELEAFL